MQELTSAMDQTSSLGTAGNGSFDRTFYDSNDPSVFNFNISDLNFGNHYGALEFGMLGHIASGASGTPDMDVMHSMGNSNQSNMSFDGTAGYPSNYGYDQAFQSWQGIPNNTGSRQSSTTQFWAPQNNGMDAFAVGEHSGSLTGTSPLSQTQDFGAGYSSNNVSPETQFAQPDQSQQPDLLRQSISQTQQQHRKQPAFPKDPSLAGFPKRRQDPSVVYSQVDAGYPYTQSFHRVTEFFQKRYPTRKVLRIARALASIRPSFIACNKNLNTNDLVHNEKTLQRTLWEYEDHLNHFGIPTVIFRRTGEVAAISKEFCLVTGWRRDVLLGKEPNLNANTGAGSSGSQTGSSSRGAATPRMPTVETDPGRPQPVFIAELMDEDSVVNFYEDFAEMAFGASRASVIGVPCSLLKYKTKDDLSWKAEERLNHDLKRSRKPGEIKSEPLMKGEAGTSALGDEDGRVACMMCWHVKRDMFDMPMLIVMNVSVGPISTKSTLADKIVVSSYHLTTSWNDMGGAKFFRCSAMNLTRKAAILSLQSAWPSGTIPGMKLGYSEAFKGWRRVCASKWRSIVVAFACAVCCVLWV